MRINEDDTPVMPPVKKDSTGGSADLGMKGSRAYALYWRVVKTQAIIYESPGTYSH